MNSDMIKLFKWFDKKTGKTLWSSSFAEQLAIQTKIPKALKEAHKVFKKCNKIRRRSLSSHYINEVLDYV